eukprot:TRINITY_DN55550_c0_g1_i1.p1 TRINITY_DN55550_c0_g1~~TRINITY_DN55550_c0_g1_i1.p1  ORF type:complete len:238 (+),score=47.11 TRINITY_DN55550_c0_g1_i1:71-784(+)
MAGSKFFLTSCCTFLVINLPHVLRAYPGMSDFEIDDVKADIRELDVGDLDDMESDVTPMFIDHLKKRKSKPVNVMDQLNAMKGGGEAMLAASGNGPQMSFATLLMSAAEKLGKEGTDKLASRWKSSLEVGGVNAQAYSIEPGKILFVTQEAGNLQKIKEFVLSQEEIDWWEFSQKKYFPEGRTKPVMEDEDRKKREQELGWRDAPKEPQKTTKKKENGDQKKRRRRSARRSGNTGEL